MTYAHRLSAAHPAVQRIERWSRGHSGPAVRHSRWVFRGVAATPGTPRNARIERHVIKK